MEKWDPCQPHMGHNMGPIWAPHMGPAKICHSKISGAYMGQKIFTKK